MLLKEINVTKMAQIDCADCLETYRPYKYIIALMRVLMFGFSDWWEFEGGRVILEQFRKHWRNPYVRSRIVNKTRTYARDDSFVENFIFYYQYLENKRRKTISATFLCFDCEKYHCTNCVSKHSGHFTFSKDDKYDISEWGRISVEMLEKLKAEGDRKRENMKREQSFLCDIVDMKCEHDKPYLFSVLSIFERYYRYARGEFTLRELYRLSNCVTNNLHILNDNKKWLVTDHKNNYIKIFNINDNKMTRLIKLSSLPDGITEIPSTDPSSCFIALGFPREKQIHIMNIHSIPTQAISSISVQGECFHLSICNNKFITLCKDTVDGEKRDSIHVIGLSGEIINIIDLNNLPIIRNKWFNTGRISVHSESETIYVCHRSKPSCVASLSLDGQVLSYVTFTDLEPEFISVDKERNVYVMSHQSPIYKLSADLRHREKIIDGGIVYTSQTTAMQFHNDRFYLASTEGLVYIKQYDSSYRTNEV